MQASSSKALVLSALALFGGKAEAQNPSSAGVRTPSGSFQPANDVPPLSSRERATVYLHDEKGDVLSRIGIYADSVAPGKDGKIKCFHAPANIISGVKFVDQIYNPDLRVGGNLAVYEVTTILSSDDIRQACKEEFCRVTNAALADVEIEVLPLLGGEIVAKIIGANGEILDGSTSLNPSRDTATIKFAYPVGRMSESPSIKNYCEDQVFRGLKLDLRASTSLQGYLELEKVGSVAVQRILDVWQEISSKYDDGGNVLKAEDLAKMAGQLKITASDTTWGSVPLPLIPSLSQFLQDNLTVSLLNDNGQNLLAGLRRLEQMVAAQSVAVSGAQAAQQTSVSHAEESSSFQTEHERFNGEYLESEKGLEYAQSVKFGIPGIGGGEAGLKGHLKTIERNTSTVKNTDSKSRANRSLESKTTVLLRGRALDFQAALQTLNQSSGAFTKRMTLDTQQTATEPISMPQRYIVSQFNLFEADLKRQQEAPKTFERVETQLNQLRELTKKIEARGVVLRDFERLSRNDFKGRVAEKWDQGNDGELTLDNLLTIQDAALAGNAEVTLVRELLGRSPADLTTVTRIHRYLAAEKLSQQLEKKIKASRCKLDEYEQLLGKAELKDKDLLEAIVRNRVLRMREELPTGGEGKEKQGADV